MLFSEATVDELSCLVALLNPVGASGDRSWVLAARELDSERSDVEDEDRLWVRFTMQGLPT